MPYISDFILLEGFEKGFEKGYTEGFKKGYRAGFEKGYREGILLVRCRCVTSLMTRMEISFSEACDLLDIKEKDRSDLLEALQKSRKVQ